MSNFLTDVTPAALSKRAAVALVAIAVLFIVLEYAVRPTIDWFYPRQLLPLVQYVNQNGQAVKGHAFVADYFGIPNDGNPLDYQQIGALSITGRGKSIAVRQRPTGQIDVMLSDLQGDQSGYFYHANVYGKLLKACLLETRPQEISDAEQRFAAEVQFWQGWLEVQQETKSTP